MIRTWLALFGIVAAFAVRPAFAAGDDLPPIRIGVVAFDKLPKSNAENPRKDLNALGLDLPVALYLHNLAANVKGARFQLYRGNYYQVLQWMESGEIDGAVLSPFMAMLVMRRDVRCQQETYSHCHDTFALATFAYSDTSANNGGALAMVSAADRNNEGLRQPARLYKEFIQSLLKLSRFADYEKRDQSKVVVNLVSHLSTSGFILPLLHTHGLLHHLLEEEKVPLPERPFVASRFWDLFFQHVRLKLWHESGAGAGDTRFDFTYADTDSPGKYSEQYDAEAFDPNDVLVIRIRDKFANATVSKSLQSDIPATTWQHVAETTENEIRARLQKADAANPPHWYKFVKPFDETKQDKFEERVRAAFLPPDGTDDACALPLKAYWERWYAGDSKYDFLADEVISLLSHDQMIRALEAGARSSPESAAAIVLPGGGVRGAYQAALLDELYGQQKLVNVRDDEVSQDRRSEQGSLIVRHVVGTSGGALVGYFAAQRHAGRNAADALLADWIKGDNVVATPDKIFPPVGLLRWISALLILAIYAIIARLTLPPNGAALVPGGKMPPLVWFGVGLSILLAPFVLWRFARLDPAYEPLREGLFYVVIVLLGHLIFTTTRSSGTFLPYKKWIYGAAAVSGTAGLAGAYYILFVFDEDAIHKLSTPWGISALSLLGMASLLAILLAAYLYAVARGIAAYGAMATYLGGLCTAGVAAFLTWAFFQAGRRIGATSSIEMTIEYWIWLVAAAIVAGAAITGLAAFRPPAVLYRAIHFWNEEHKDRRLLRTPGQSLIAFGIAAIALWTAFAAPALYSSFYGYKTFHDSADRFARNHRLLANFVATTTSLGTAQLKGSPRYKGDYYVCIQDDEACGMLHLVRPERVFPFPAQDRERVLNAVFASGSPFPIYPSRRLQVDSDKSGMFMDGGYAHNTPLEAAGLLEAQQVLIVNSAQRRDDARGSQAERTVSDLAVDSATLFPFLFDRSQMTDKLSGGGMLVASLSPYGGHEPEAFLMDFRESTVRGLCNAAMDDFARHRIGRVESWGRPARLLYDSGDPKADL